MGRTYQKSTLVAFVSSSSFLQEKGLVVLSAKTVTEWRPCLTNQTLYEVWMLHTPSGNCPQLRTIGKTAFYAKRKLKFNNIQIFRKQGEKIFYPICVGFFCHCCYKGFTGKSAISCIHNNTYLQELYMRAGSLVSLVKT